MERALDSAHIEALEYLVKHRYMKIILEEREPGDIGDIFQHLMKIGLVRKTYEEEIIGEEPSVNAEYWIITESGRAMLYELNEKRADKKKNDIKYALTTLVAFIALVFSIASFFTK